MAQWVLSDLALGGPGNPGEGGEAQARQGDTGLLSGVFGGYHPRPRPHPSLWGCVS